MMASLLATEPVICFASMEGTANPNPFAIVIADRAFDDDAGILRAAALGDGAGARQDFARGV